MTLLPILIVLMAVVGNLLNKVFSAIGRFEDFIKVIFDSAVFRQVVHTHLGVADYREKHVV